MKMFYCSSLMGGKVAQWMSVEKRILPLAGFLKAETRAGFCAALSKPDIHRGAVMCPDKLWRPNT